MRNWEKEDAGIEILVGIHKFEPWTYYAVFYEVVEQGVSYKYNLTIGCANSRPVEAAFNELMTSFLLNELQRHAGIRKRLPFAKGGGCGEPSHD